MLFGALFRPLEQNKSKKNSKDVDDQCAENGIAIIADNKTLQNNFEMKTDMQCSDKGQIVGQSYDQIELPEQNREVQHSEMNVGKMNRRNNTQSAFLQESNIFHKNLNKDSTSSLVPYSTDRGVTLLSVQFLSTAADLQYNDLSNTGRILSSPNFKDNGYVNKAFPGSFEDIDLNTKKQEVAVVNSNHVILDEKTGCLGKCVRNKYMDFTILINPVFAVYGLSCFMVMAGKYFKQYVDILIWF